MGPWDTTLMMAEYLSILRMEKITKVRSYFVSVRRYFVSLQYVTNLYPTALRVSFSYSENFILYLFADIFSTVVLIEGNALYINKNCYK